MNSISDISRVEHIMWDKLSTHAAKHTQWKLSTMADCQQTRISSALNAC